MDNSTQINIDWNKIIPPYNCKLHIKILEEKHSVNPLHNIVIYRKSICKICNKIFEVSDEDDIK